MDKHEKIVVPQKYDISEVPSPEKELGEKIELDFKENARDEQKTWLLKIVGGVFVLVVLLTQIYAVATSNDEIVSRVFDRIINLVLILLAYYFGKTNGQKK